VGKRRQQEHFMGKTLLVVGEVATHQPPLGSAPRKDYLVLRDALDATILNPSSVEGQPLARALARALGMPVALAWLAFTRRAAYDVLLTDGEHIGIPLALLLKLARATTPMLTLGHRITPFKKQVFFRWLKIQTHMAKIVLHASYQQELAVERLGIAPDRLAVVPYQVDTEFWRPLPVAEERMICSAGLEFRDYPTLFRAVQNVDVKVVIGAASHWSRRRNTARDLAIPANVEVGAFDYQALRDLYARAAFVVVPLDDVDFQAGITTILEAMAMGKAVVVSHTPGQTDVVVDRRERPRGRASGPTPTALLQRVAHEAGITISPNGFYVPTGDATTLRQAILYLLDHPEERASLGAAGRQAVERLMNVDHFAARLKRLVEQSSGRVAASAAGTDRPRSHQAVDASATVTALPDAPPMAVRRRA
jgi:glycosyltransferase involved in cell wall biosynthesis